MTLELSPPVATVSGTAEWLYETDTPTQVAGRGVEFSIPFTVPSSGTVVIIYKPRTVTSPLATSLRVIDVYRDGATNPFARTSTSSHSSVSDDTAPYTYFAQVSEGEHYLKFRVSAWTLEFDVVSIRVGFIPTT